MPFGSSVCFYCKLFPEIKSFGMLQKLVAGDVCVCVVLGITYLTDD